MHLDLTYEEAQFLEHELESHLRARERELAHTESRALQRAIASDTERLTTLLGRLRVRRDEAHA